MAPRLRGARLEGLLPFHLKQRHHQAFRSFLFLFLRLNFGSSLPGAGVGGGGRNTFFSTIFNLLLFIKLSSSFGGLKQTWTESGKTNSSEARRRLSLANWLLAALWKLHVLRAHGGGPSSCAMGGVGGAPLETPRHSGQRDPRAVPSEMLAPWFGPIQGALGCGVPPSQAFPGAATGTADSVALLLGHGSWNQPA